MHSLREFELEIYVKYKVENLRPQRRRDFKCPDRGLSIIHIMMSVTVGDEDELT